MSTPDIQELQQRAAIEDVLTRYCRALDWLDAESLEEVFWPDAEIDYGFFRGSGEAFVPFLLEVETRAARRWHASLNSAVRIDGDRAEVESYGLAQGTAAHEDRLTDTVFAGRYLDVFECREGEWRIARRKFVLDWTHSFPSGVGPFRAPGAAMKLHVLDVRESGHPEYRKL